MSDEEKAVTVVEEEKPTIESPKINSIIVPTKDGPEEAPDGKNPFFLLYKEGLFLHLNSALGRVIVKQKTMPRHLRSLESDGYFWWKAPYIPPEICAQAVSFFKRIWEKHKTEAGIYLLMNYETQEWSIFVPTQKTTSASVDYVTSPDEIPEKHLVMGTMHSHCDFSPFHSSTDMHDAEEMNGVHFTVGYLDRDEPEHVAMVSWNGEPFNFKPNVIADFTKLDSAVAPEEWDEKVIPTKVVLTQQQKELFEKYGKKSTWQPTGGSWRPPEQNQGWGQIPDDWDELYEFPKYKNKPSFPPSENYKNDGYWEDYLDAKTVDAIIDSDVLTDIDLDYAAEYPNHAKDKTFWTAVFLRKLSATATVLDKLGYVIDYSVKVKKFGAEEKTYDALEDLKKILDTNLEQMAIFRETEEDIEQALLPEITKTRKDEMNVH